ncbi:MAG TPA: transposase [Firmicutes bacterium]|nr:transposase [Bacillota bacterium]
MDEKKREEIALKRFALISPVTTGREQNAAAYFRSVCEQPIDMPHYGVREYSPKTLRRWMNDYNRHGFDALKPGFRSDRGKSRKMTPQLEQAILEKIEAYPRMKGSVIYDQLVKEDKLEPANLSRSTFYRYLANQSALKGLGGGKVEKTKRFAYKFINELWQADVMHGPRIRDGLRKQETYLICFLDDASRLIPYSGFAFKQDFLTLRQFLKEAVQRRGKPKMLYTDNAKIYRTQQLALICAGFGCSVVHARPYHAAGKGKQERFFGTVRTRFLSTITDENITLEELNERYWHWLDEDYHRKKHSSLGKSPLDFFMEQADRIEHIGDPAVVDALFLLRTTRKIRSNATLQVNNVIYETDYSLVGSTVQVRYEPDWIGQPHRKLPLYVDSIHVGDATFVQLHDNALKRRPSGRVESPPEMKLEKPLSRVSYTKAVKGDED